MLWFASDYMEGAHEKILQRLIETNREKTGGYGADPYTESAKEKIKAACQCPKAEIFFLTGGTQTNATVIASVLKQYEGVISVTSGHIANHEAGAIENSGHKVFTLPSENGKMLADDLRRFLEDFWADENHEHGVFPGMVYLSHPTEYGTLYSAGELEEISGICKEFQIPLYLDGARLGYGLASRHTDVTLPVIAKYCDIFYIGGTKVGALCGEAVVFTEGNMPPHFMTMVKQRGALLAKGRVLGLQFDTLFTDGLYFAISKHAIDMAELLRQGLEEKGCNFYMDSPTNQQFLVLEDTELERLQEKVAFVFWEKLGDKHTVVRLATSWATKEEDVRALIDLF